MAIHRVGPAPGTQPHEKSLGRLLVTIDDLDALMNLLRQHHGPTVAVNFEGGYFDQSEDLRRLSDEELETLRISADGITLFLEPTQAIAFSEQRESLERLYTLWARSRQTRKEQPRLYRLSRLYPIGTGITGAMLSLLVFRLLQLAAEPTGQPSLWFGAALVAVPVVYAIALYRRACRNYATYAVIKPLSAHEYRQVNATNKWPRWTVIVAIAAIAFGTATAFLVPIFTR